MDIILLKIIQSVFLAHNHFDIASNVQLGLFALNARITVDLNKIKILVSNALFLSIIV